MRLGEGSGCPVAMQIIQNACDIMNNMQTFQDINLEEEYRKDIKIVNIKSTVLLFIL